MKVSSETFLCAKPMSLAEFALPRASNHPGRKSLVGEASKTIGLEQSAADHLTHPLNANQKHAADVVFWGAVVLPKFTDFAEAKVPGFKNADATKQKNEIVLSYVGSLIDAYKAIEAHPDDPLKQAAAFERRGGNEGSYLSEVRAMLPELAARKVLIYDAAHSWGYADQNRYRRQTRWSVRHTLGKDEIAFLPEFILSKDMVAELAFLNSTVLTFKQDARAHMVELRQKPQNKGKSKRQIRKEHIRGMIEAFAMPKDPDAPESYYDQRLKAVTERLEQNRVELSVQAETMTKAQQFRVIRKAVKTFESHDDVIDLKERTGLTEETITDAKRALIKEGLKSAAWPIAGEAVVFVAGWVTAATQEYLLDIKHTAALGVAAGLSRLGVIGMVAWKGYWNEKLAEKRGTASDPFSKYTKEKWGKAWIGYTGTNGGFEGLYAANTAANIAALGWGPGFAAETAQNITGIVKMIGEVAAMRKLANGEHHEPGKIKKLYRRLTQRKSRGSINEDREISPVGFNDQTTEGLTVINSTPTTVYEKNK